MQHSRQLNNRTSARSSITLKLANSLTHKHSSMRAHASTSTHVHKCTCQLLACYQALVQASSHTNMQASSLSRARAHTLSFRVDSSARTRQQKTRGRLVPEVMGTQCEYSCWRPRSSYGHQAAPRCLPVRVGGWGHCEQRCLYVQSKHF